ncbi:MAG: 16S rRNA (adenine(1518)-N(6)/adenine(1519)-N(6))-dimethyltransferase RsmA [Acutalibacteraceae bacterium]|nr:16S rRNA (adenine(1518)-N(6)/adenine(1519)-N(6))-dimethyltransferase RsmA [Acutalibacteraceae bacterium]
MNLSDIGTIKKLLNADDFSFKKSLGQNFLIDDTVCPRMAEFSVDDETGVLEIGPGIGVLTRAVAERAKRVVAIELDERLRPILAKTLADLENTEVIFGDAMKTDLSALIAEKFADCKRVAVCANLPYYITSPIIMQLLESRLPIDNITVMVQKEAAERLCADVSSRDAGAVTVAVEYYADSEILFHVGRDSFMPPPKVDSAVIRLSVRKEPKYKVDNEKKFFSLVKACFAQRRKTLLNTVSSTLKIEKAALCECLKELGLREDIRAEKLKMEELCALSNLLSEKGIY